MNIAPIAAWQQPPFRQTLNMTNRSLAVATPPSFLFGRVPDPPVKNWRIWLKRFYHLVDLAAEINWEMVLDVVQNWLMRRVTFFRSSVPSATRQ